jgi:hypothetical protein
MFPCRLSPVFILLLLAFSLSGIASPLPTDSLPKTKPAYTIFLLGDAGNPYTSTKDPVLSILQQQMQEAGANSAVLYLGDNIYPAGLQNEGEFLRNSSEKKLSTLLDILKGYPGRGVVIPGNHDWQQGGPSGWDYVRNQEQFVMDYLQNTNVFFPSGGCPGPVEIPLTKELTLIVVDTQWWLHKGEKPGLESDCDAKELSELLVQLDDMVQRNAGKRIIVAAHHPMYSAGTHGGYYVWKNHLFPLLELNENLYIPMPVIGSIYPLYRTLFGDIQDISHPKYKAMRDGMTAIFRQHPNLVFVNGHEHSMQHIVVDSINYVVSGSGSKISPVKKRKNSLFAEDKKGFGRIDYYPNGEAWLSFWEPVDTLEGKQLYQAQLLKSYREQAAPAPDDKYDFKDTTITIVASELYRSKRFKQWLLGENYRKTWLTPIPVPLINLRKEAGGLTIVQRGGGQQTKSLRLEAKDGKQYVLRSVEKYAENAIPEPLRGSLAADIVQDQISASHPFAAVVIPPLAKAAGILHTHPRLVLIPDDPILGQYRKVFGNTLSIFEERPDDGFENSAVFGGAKKIYSTTKTLEKIYKDNDNQVDQQSVLRARLFDILIGDWDRHDDQWRWANFKTDTSSLFQPIARDRDQAFFTNQGLIPRIASRKWIMPKFQGFSSYIRDVASLNFNARYFDRSFLTELERKDWLAMADTLQQRLPDSVIEQAIHLWPEPVYKLEGETIITKLKKRREDLGKYAEEYYQFLAKNVDVAGSAKKEFFDVQRLPDGKTKVTLYKINKDDKLEQELYNRTFLPGETKEVRLYGLGGDDLFRVWGKTSKGVRVRIIGGKGNDSITDSSHVNGWGKKTIVYDTKTGNTLQLGSESRNLTGDYASVNTYDRKSFKYNYLGPLLSVQYNPDDGVFLGGGVMIKTQGFRKDPFATRHRITANYAFATNAYNIRYNGDFADLLGRIDLQVNTDVRAPNFVNNFFGLGNETVYNKENDINYYRVRSESISLNTLLLFHAGKKQTFFIGPAFSSVEVEPKPDRFITDPVNNKLFSDNLFDRKNYGGAKLGFTIDTRDDEVLPTQGVYWNTESHLFRRLNVPIGTSKEFAQLQSDFSLYWTIKRPLRITFATRFGGGVNFTDYEFFQANSLGGLTNLRGFRRTRFSGNSSFYNNSEVRVRLLAFKTYLFPGYLGVIGFNDVGRVWVDGENSNTWHHGYGGGIWVAPFKMVVVSGMYTFSKEDHLPIVRVGFFF